MSKNGWIGVDLDGTLASYTSFKGWHHIGPPIPRTVKRVRKAIRLGFEVRIFTARAVMEDEILARIDLWSETHIGKILPVTNEKDSEMIELWDDRAVAIEHNTGVMMSRSQIAELNDA